MNQIASSLVRPLVLATTLSFLPPFAIAQETSGDGSTVIYAADYFAEYSPITAQDMLDRIPGQGQANGSPGGGRGGSGGGGGGPPGSFGGGGGNPSAGGRGLGAGSSGNDILVNGKRTAGKNNQTGGLLRRITASQVREIQIIRGTSGDLDVRGSSQVINVVLFEELSSNSISYEATMDQFKNNEIQPGGSASLSGQYGAFTYQLSAASRARYGLSTTKEQSIRPDFSPNDLIREERVRDGRNNEISMNMALAINNSSSVRLNGLYATNDAPADVMRYTKDLTRVPNGFTIEHEDIPNDRDNWELGGDYELTMANGNRFKFLAIANRDNNTSTRERFKWLGDASEQKNLFLFTDAITEERIARSSYTFDLMENQDVEFGLERAQTILDSKLNLGLLTTGGVSAAFGGLVPQNVDNANSRVEEIRYEPFAIHNWQLNPRMSLETTLLYEMSEITQTGDVYNQRDFDFIKPKFDLRFDVTPQWQLRGIVEKVVNQLSFADFVAANDDQDNDANTQAGNAELRQQWSWRYTFNTEYRLPNDVGVLNAEFFYFDQRDVIERLDVSPNAATLVSANGNIGDGWEYGTNLSASTRLAMLGLPNVLFTYTLNVQDSEITDPFLGIERRFQNYQRGRSTYVFRHDLPQWRMNWGMQVFDRIDNGMERFDIDDIEMSVGDPRVNLFVEYVDSFGLTWRFDGGGLTNGAQCRDRFRFDGRISAGILEEVEHQCVRDGMTASLRVSGTFQ